jgi:hypothetical protein
MMALGIEMRPGIENVDSPETTTFHAPTWARLNHYIDYYRWEIDDENAAETRPSDRKSGD